MAKKDKKYEEKRESRKEEKQNRKVQKKADRKEKYAQLSLAEKIGRFAMKICLSILVIVAIVSCGIVALTYFDVIEVPAVSYFLDRSGIVRQTKVDTDPMIHNYIPEEDSIAVDEETNLFYAKDEILVIFSKDATEEQKNKVITFLNGELAGSVPEINMYQIKISSCDTLENLEEIADAVMEEFDYVIYATYDTAVSNPKSTYVPNDPWDGDVDEEDWENNTVDGSNWWIEAIEAQRAWDYKDKFSSINVGICDSSFDVGHEDLKNKVSFPNDVLKSRNIVTPWWQNFDAKTYWLDVAARATQFERVGTGTKSVERYNLSADGYPLVGHTFHSILQRHVVCTDEVGGKRLNAEYLVVVAQHNLLGKA